MYLTPEMELDPRPPEMELDLPPPEVAQLPLPNPSTMVFSDIEMDLEPQVTPLPDEQRTCGDVFMRTPRDEAREAHLDYRMLVKRRRAEQLAIGCLRRSRGLENSRASLHWERTNRPLQTRQACEPLDMTLNKLDGARFCSPARKTWDYYQWQHFLKSRNATGPPGSWSYRRDTARLRKIQRRKRARIERRERARATSSDEEFDYTDSSMSPLPSAEAMEVEPSSEPSFYFSDQVAAGSDTLKRVGLLDADMDTIDDDDISIPMFAQMDGSFDDAPQGFRPR